MTAGGMIGGEEEAGEEKKWLSLYLKREGKSRQVAGRKQGIF